MDQTLARSAPAHFHRWFLLFLLLAGFAILASDRMEPPRAPAQDAALLAAPPRDASPASALHGTALPPGDEIQARAAGPIPAPLPSLEQAPEDTFSSVARVVAIGDVHGDADALEKVLRLAGVLSESGHWSGGRTHLVQTGDVPDRGDQTRRALDLLMRLEVEARSAGGRLHALLGNHEVMNMDGDLRYVTPAELESYADLSPAAEASGTDRGRSGHQATYALSGRYGRWLRGHAAVVRVNDTLFLHGGIAPEVRAPDLRALNQWVRQDLFSGNPAGGARLPSGPLWFRGYALEPEAALAAGLDGVLERFGARRMVMGHTTTNGQLEQRFGGKAIFIDCGMARHYGSHLAALELVGQTLTAIYPDRREELIPPVGPVPGLK